MRREELVERVKTEAALLKRHATQEELLNLSIEHLNPMNVHSCIYGLMTGSCWGERAFDLFKSCAKPTADALYRAYTKKIISLEVSDYCEYSENPSCDRPFSAMEIFITNSNEKTNSKLISYLRGETNILDIK